MTAKYALENADLPDPLNVRQREGLAADLKHAAKTCASPAALHAASLDIAMIWAARSARHYASLRFDFVREEAAAERKRVDKEVQALRDELEALRAGARGLRDELDALRTETRAPRQLRAVGD